MTGIWTNDGSGWRLQAPSGFPDEARLHTLVEQAPQVLPLAGSPALVILGREVQLGSGKADLVAVEPTGRPTIIEVKLARNAESRRAIVAQVLSYAAFLHGMDVEGFEGGLLSGHLRARGYDSLVDAVRQNDQAGSLDETAFLQELTTSLAEGRFRLVLVLDDAPADLVRLVGYLGAVAEKLLIDLVVVSSFDIGGSQALLPQRVDAERVGQSPVTPAAAPATSRGVRTEGAADFEAAIPDAMPEFHDELRRYVVWAKGLEASGLAKLQSYLGQKQMVSLLPRLPAEGVGLATIYIDGGKSYIQLWRSVFDRNCPEMIDRVEAAISPNKLTRGVAIRNVSDETLDLLTQAYQAAAHPTATL